eukprot:9721967-Karenia_brevis.AAC.1
MIASRMLWYMTSPFVGEKMQPLNYTQAGFTHSAVEINGGPPAQIFPVLLAFPTTYALYGFLSSGGG